MRSLASMQASSHLTVDGLARCPPFLLGELPFLREGLLRQPTRPDTGASPAFQNLDHREQDGCRVTARSAWPQPIDFAAEAEMSGPLTDVRTLSGAHGGRASCKIRLAEAPQFPRVGDGRHGDHESTHVCQSALCQPRCQRQNRASPSARYGMSVKRRAGADQYQRCATSTTTLCPPPGSFRTNARMGSLARTPSPIVVCPSKLPAQATWRKVR